MSIRPCPLADILLSVERTLQLQALSYWSVILVHHAYPNVQGDLTGHAQ